MLSPEQARTRVASALERAAAFHEAGRYRELEGCFELVDVPEVRVSGEDGERIGIALDFFDGWVDASNHDWLYYEGIERGDWPRLARALASSLRGDGAIDAPQLARFDPRSAGSSRVHAVTFGSMAGLVSVAAVFMLAGVAAGTLGSAPWVALLSSLPMLFAVLARLRLRVYLTPDSVEYRGLFGARRIRVAEVSWAGWPVHEGWLASRLWGPFVYELRAPGTRLRVNLKLFSAECAQALTQLVPPSP